ncbi:NhaP-type Na+/H+ or K+/H+ antiporter [Wenyingzhuangia heitensis]|uniref:NhaP-type Na+/H+ or K+/H+ antiporter n=1 Tax=Wenyingzhuangia heitensis TaxID=1487859 RepID=A0ABX0UGD0_9FLAO|nr:sodium:proton antiporter [Wenyingzhuangia heitensis]NIJ46067.1 NhaP-type Na+/H+ or K+/H+ antiporter [Wenyingzhuangia heitensis]
MIELAGIIILGIIAQWAAWKLKLPAILPLILIGLIVGPVSTLITEDGSKWIEPVWNGTNGLFAGESLFYFVSLAISIILFEGGLTLKKKEVLNVGPSIIRLITIGTIITFFGAGIAVHYLFQLSWSISLLFSSLIIVTGPTVITPILRNIRLKRDVSAILKWEGILIDPIGALVAVLVFEFISVDNTSDYTQTAIIEFSKIVLFGFTFGFTFAHAFNFILKKSLVPKYLLNVFTLAYVLGVFVLSDSFAHESGLLSVVIMGMVLGNIDMPHLKEILDFKESLSVLLISILFILLSANMNVKDFDLINNWQTLALFGIIILIVRPLGVFLSTKGSGLKFTEKTFISWVGPRGIVAAGIASLFGLKLVAKGEAGAEYITPLVFVIVLGTVLLNATTARLVARLLGVYVRSSKGILIVGASEVSRVIAQYLEKRNRYVVLIDNNADKIKLAQDMGLNAEVVDVFSDDVSNNIEFTDIGYLLALTGSKKVNTHTIHSFRKRIDASSAFRFVSETELSDGKRDVDANLLSLEDDFIRFSELIREYPQVNEINLTSQEDFTAKNKQLTEQLNTIPLFVSDEKGELYVIAAANEKIKIGKNCKLIYIGEPLSKKQVVIDK